MACGAGQTAERSLESVRSTDVASPAKSTNRTLQTTVYVKPNDTPEHKKVPHSLPTMTPAPTYTLKPPNTPGDQGTARLTPTDVPEPTPSAYLPKTVVVKTTPTPRPEPTHAPPAKKKVVDRSHHVATATDLVKLADPDTKIALLNPGFLDVNEANSQYTDSELVIGLSVNGQHKAYSTSFMATWIVNDTVGGDPLLVTY